MKTCFEFLNEKMEEALSQSDEYASAQKQSRLFRQQIKKIEKDLPVLAKEFGKLNFGELNARYDEIASLPSSMNSKIAELESRVSKMWFDSKEQEKLLEELESSKLLAEQAQTFLSDYPHENIALQASECESVCKNIARIEKQSARKIILENKDSEQVGQLFSHVLSGQKVDEKALGTYGLRFVEAIAPKRSVPSKNIAR